MNADGALVELARCHGIEHGYHDIWGTWHALSESTARALLGAMGVPAADDAAVQRALADVERSDWHALAPPVLVARRDDAPRVPVCLPDASDGLTLHWEVTQDDGGVRRGESSVRDLPVLAERDRDGLRLRRRELVLPGDLGTGRHRLVLHAGERRASLDLVVAPRRCAAVPSGPDGRRAWGVTLQLYGLRSGRNWGIGDFGDLGNAIATLADLGVDMVGLNPLHALYPDTPEHASPYSPSSRRFLNPIYLDVTAIQDFAECDAVREQVFDASFQSRLAAWRASALVDYQQVGPAKLAVLRRLYEHFRDCHLAADSERAADFRRFREHEGDALRRHAIFETIHAAHAGERAAPWPRDLLDPRSPAVDDFASRHADDVAFAEYLQWQSALQMRALARRAHACGMRVGLYLDLAVGSDGHGADVWAAPQAHGIGVSIGAPPDDLGPQGQVWGLSPWTPRALREQAYRPFEDCLRASMRDAGALRIDHVLGLLRQFWVPAGCGAADGAYVRFPLHDLLAVTALESVRAGCVVVGEDLGTVPDEMRAALAEYGLLSYRVLYFEKHWHGDHSFRAPAEYPRDALVTVATHDLATFAGYWSGRDLELRETLGLYPDPGVAGGQREGREHDRWRLLDALSHEGLRPETPGEPGSGPATPELIIAVHRFLARTPAALLSVQMEDVLCEVEQANVPGTVHEQPNWCRKLALPIEAWAGDPALRALAQAVHEERGR